MRKSDDFPQVPAGVTYGCRSVADGDPITVEALRYLAGPEGRVLLQAAAASTGAEWQTQTALRRTFPAAMCRAAVALVELRRTAHAKFPLADAMFFDRAGLEMASRSEVAHYHAARLAGHGSVLDLCCGIGGDLVEIARTCRVVGVDADVRRALMAQRNCEALAAAPRGIVVADVTTMRLHADVVYIDPARRDGRGRHSRTSAAYTPPLAFATGLCSTIPHVAIKVSPAIPDEELPTGWEIEFISSAGQCRECTLYGGALASTPRRATILPGRHSLVAGEGAAVAVAPPGAFLYEPDPAVVRAHLIDELARILDAWKLDPQVAYLSGATYTPSPFVRAFRVLAVRPFHLNSLRRFLQREGLRPVEIKKRRFPLTPESVRRKLGIGRGGIPVTLVLTRLGERSTCLICSKVT